MVNLHKDIDGRAYPENKVFYPYSYEIMPYDIPKASDTAVGQPHDGAGYYRHHKHH